MMGRRYRVLPLLLVGYAVAWAVAGAPADLKTWHDRTVHPHTAVTPEEARAARAKLTEWALNLADLSPTERRDALELEIYTSLGEGNVLRAQDQYAALAHEFPGAKETLRAAWDVATAAGDAQLAAQTLDKLAASQVAPEAAIAARRARLANIAAPAPDETVTAGDQSYALRSRDGRPLLLEFWSAAKPPTKAQGAALRLIADAAGADLDLCDVALDADGKDVAALRQAAEYTCPGTTATRAADWVRFFVGADNTWAVVVDGFGYVRAVGSVREPGFQYAARAAAVESTHRLPAVLPRSVAGVQAERPAPPKPTEDAAEAQPAQRPPSELPSNAEAASMMRQARAYAKTGRKNDARKLLREIVEKYPGTREAAEAADWLKYL